MIVVADSSPLHYLILLNQVTLLHHFYGEVLVPDPVAHELRAARSPDPVREWMFHVPAWINVTAVTPEEIGSVSEGLDLGERAAIALAERTRADLLLIDEVDGRAEAVRRNFRVTGTLGVLRAAAGEGLIDVRAVLNGLAATSFYADEALIAKIFSEWLSD